ncbi:MAG: TrmB family transcriptional regulator [Planctomycetes bacterium]|nr:TrmB family transcriptional regulator [Planctomycetota bacterium]
MSPDEQVRKLRKLGLSRYEALAYLALLGEAGLAAARVALKAGIPQPRVYGALGTLVDRGFAEIGLAEPRTYRAIAPSVAFARHKQRTEKAFAAAMDEIEGEMSLLEKLKPLAESEDPAAFGIRLLRGARQSEQAFVGSYEAARTEILLFVKAPVLYPPTLDNDRELAARGVKLRWLVEESLVNDPALGPGYAEFARHCGQLRTRASLPIKLAIFDRRLLAMPLFERDQTPTLLLIPNAVLAGGMAAWFEDLWQRAEVHTPGPQPRSNRKKQTKRA